MARDKINSGALLCCWMGQKTPAQAAVACGTKGFVTSRDYIELLKATRSLIKIARMVAPAVDHKTGRVSELNAACFRAELATAEKISEKFLVEND